MSSPCAVDHLRTAVRLLREAAVGLSPAARDQLDAARNEVEAALAGLDPGIPPIPLTARQEQVLRELAQGCGAKEIASDLGISVKTVEFHKARIMELLGVRSLAGLTRIAVARGLVEPL